MPLVNQSELARMIGLSQPYISRLIKKGILTTDEGGKIDSESARLALQENLDAASRKKRIRSQGPDRAQPEKDDDQISFMEARRRNEVYRAKLAKIELEKVKGNLLESDETRSAIITICRAARDALLSISSRIGPLLAAESDLFKITQLLDGEILATLEALESDFSKKSLL